MSKQIHKLIWKEFRCWKSMSAEYLLQKFEDIKYIQKINIVTRQVSACTIEAEDFISFLLNIFVSSSPLIPNDFDKIPIRYIQIFRMEELNIVLQSMANLKDIDENGIVIEVIKHVTSTFKERVISLFN